MKHLLKSAVVLFVLVNFSSCKSGSADKKVKEIADEMCGCFDKFSKNLTTDEMAVLKVVSTAAKPQTALREEFRKMDEKAAVPFSDKIKSIGDKNSEVFKCLESFDKKHATETTKDKTALTEKLLIELQSNNCTIGAAMMNLSLGKGVK